MVGGGVIKLKKPPYLEYPTRMYSTRRTRGKQAKRIEVFFPRSSISATSGRPGDSSTVSSHHLTTHKSQVVLQLIDPGQFFEIRNTTSRLS